MVIAYSDGQQIGRFELRDWPFKNSLEPDPARFQLTKIIWLPSTGLFPKAKSAA